jgi:hypothetical protein
MHFLRKPLTAAGPEDPDTLPAVRAHEAAHVLHDAEYVQVQLAAECDGFSHRCERHLLRRCHNDRSVRVLDELLVVCSRTASCSVARPMAPLAVPASMAGLHALILSIHSFLLEIHAERSIHS